MKVPPLVVCAGAAIVLACGAPEEITPAIAVQPGAAARAMMLLGHGGPNDPAVTGVAPLAEGGATEDDEDASADEYKGGSGGK